MGSFNCASPEELSFIANIIAIELSAGKNADELNVLGNFIVAIGGLMLAIAAQKQNLESLSKDDDNKKRGSSN
ncbi:hypothetical protein [Clostridium tetani]|uniref:Uncharacterized protein n=1 Tax=Clostridium tetani TaxID=1513 RepID=A0ABY0EPM8_CLOTA|nr:hypothetical protein [Clostridium tetani]CDI49652.1 hypothetical protein BN906_01655 [Clostridium tetani 12124569]AVP55765.1 hypothetical protein C3B72_11710 [Clostridium tetani]KGI37999.1 hypothetical protein KY52_10805 [Clostridium tetani]KGI39899.1 hypothetical protein LA33_04180 [Clostridium tetani ATCC 9441]KGI43090.1 hypothetical protein KY54_10660 [Clostridium tetani]